MFFLNLDEEAQPDIPAVSVLLMSALGDSIFPGHLCASDAIHEICFWGRSTNFIWLGDKEGWRDVSIAMS